MPAAQYAQLGRTRLIRERYTYALLDEEKRGPDDIQGELGVVESDTGRSILPADIIERMQRFRSDSSLTGPRAGRRSRKPEQQGGKHSPCLWTYSDDMKLV